MGRVRWAVGGSALAAALWAAFHFSPLLVSSFAAPGTDSARAAAILKNDFAVCSDNASSIVP